MALPSSGRITLNDVAIELGSSSGTRIALTQPSVRTLYGVSSGRIRLAADGYGKSSEFSATISTNQQELNLRTWALANGWNGTSAVTITVGSNVYIWSDNIATPALTINGSWPGGIIVVNNGFIMGKGGNGAIPSASSCTPATNGGSAISLGVNVSITNNSTIGGGGGGGSSANGNGEGGSAGGGGGAGGGNGGLGWSFEGSVAGGTGGAIGESGTNGGNFYAAPYYTYATGGGGGGGRVFPGVGGAGGTGSFGTNNGGKGGTGGGGGGGTFAGVLGNPSNDGGAGGSAGGVGARGTGNANQFPSAGGGGGWGAAGGQQAPNGTPTAGSGGKCVALNGFTATFLANGTRYGAIS